MSQSTALESRLLEAHRLEVADPRKALQLYGQAERANREFSLPMLLFTFACLVAAGLTAFFVTRAVNSLQTLLAFLILFFVGFVPPTLAYMLRSRRRYQSGSRPHTIALFLPIYAFGLMWEEALTAVLALVVVGVPLGAAVGGLLLGANGLLHLASGVDVLSADDAFALAGAPCVLLGLGVGLADLPPTVLLSPLRGVSETLAGLRMNLRKVGQYAVAVFVGTMVVGAGELQLLYGHWWQAGAAAGAAGVLVGLTLAPIPRDVGLPYLTELGRIRCDIRLGRPFSARWRIRHLAERSDPEGRRDTVEVTGIGRLSLVMADCLETLVPQDPWTIGMFQEGLEGWFYQVHVCMFPSLRREARLQWAARQEERITELMRGGFEATSGIGKFELAWQASVDSTTSLLQRRAPHLVARATESGEDHDG